MINIFDYRQTLSRISELNNSTAKVSPRRTAILYSLGLWVESSIYIITMANISIEKTAFRTNTDAADERAEKRKLNEQSHLGPVASEDGQTFSIALS